MDKYGEREKLKKILLNDNMTYKFGNNSENNKKKHFSVI